MILFDGGGAKSRSKVELLASGQVHPKISKLQNSSRYSNFSVICVCLVTVCFLAGMISVKIQFHKFCTYPLVLQISNFARLYRGIVNYPPPLKTVRLFFGKSWDLENSAVRLFFGEISANLSERLFTIFF